MHSFGFLICCVVGASLGAPSTPRSSTIFPVTSKSQVPYWHRPCGSDDAAEALDTRNAEEDVTASLRILKEQHTLMMNDYNYRDYEYLYDRVRIGVHQHQYIPNWLPDKKDSHKIKRLMNANPQVIANHLPKFHSDLQKFAVALEEMVEDEVYSLKVRNALLTTQNYLKTMLCEVESSVIALPALILPGRVERSIMNEVEREPIDDTRRLIRDWGVLLKYKDYLHAWKHVFDSGAF